MESTFFILPLPSGSQSTYEAISNPFRSLKAMSLSQQLQAFEDSAVALRYEIALQIYGT